MFYKKNQEKTLSPDLFKNPTAEYRATPFWAWNDDLSKDELLRQIGEFKKMGFGGFHMHTRCGLATPYLSNEFFDLIRSCVGKAKDEDMLAYLYDEDRWPSGAAGSLVTKTPRYRQKALVFVCADDKSKKARGRWGLAATYGVASEGAENYATAYTSANDSFDSKREAIRACADKAQTYLLAAYDVILNEDGTLRSAEIIGHDDTPKGRKWLAYVYTYPCIGWFNGATYLDTLSEEAVDEFIRVTYDKYYEEVGSEFGKTIPSIFTDEPQMAFTTNMPFADGIDGVAIPWTTDYPETFKETYGFDIIPRIPEIFWDKKDAAAKVRHSVLDHACERFSRSFSDRIGAWCRDHGIELTGHMMFEPTLLTQTTAVGEAMRGYRSFGIPGIDMLCDRMEINTAKQAQSAVHQYGREGLMSELYGVTGWAFDFRGHKFQGDWQAALGVSLRVPHLSWVSMRGSAKRDYPASISYQSAWYREYKYIEDHFARVNTAMTRGVPAVNVAVIHPIESYWLAYGPEDKTAARREQLDGNFTSVTDWLLRGCIDFDFISESEFPNLYTPSEDSRLSVGAMSYRAVVVPPVETLRSTTIRILTEFQKRGGKVIVLSQAPSLVDAEKSDAARPLYESATHAEFTALSLLEALREEREVEIVKKTGAVCRDLIYSKRRDTDGEWVFIAPLTRLWDNPDGLETSLPVYIRFAGDVKPTLYDTITGEIREIPYVRKNGYTEVFNAVYPYDTLLFKLEKSGEESRAVPAKPRYVEKRLDVKTRVPFTLSEDNVLVLDMPEWSEDGVAYNPREEMLRIDLALRKKYGYPRADGTDVQPWVIGEVRPDKVAYLRFRFRSEVAVSCRLAYETALSVTLNGKDVPVTNEGYFADKSIHTMALPPLKKGINELIVKAPLGKRTSLENLFLLGRFGVSVNGTEAKVTALPKSIAFGSVTDKGLPFYGANVTYHIPFTLEKAADVRIKVGHYEGALVTAAFDGKEAGKIVFPPYTLEPQRLARGKHTLDLTLHLTRINTFGALHLFGKLAYKGPMHWYTEGEKWAYEYQLFSNGILKSPVFEILCDEQS